MIVAGFGFRAQASADSLRAALAATGGAARVTALASAADKVATPAFQDFAATMTLPVHAVEAAALRGAPTVTRSAASLAARGTGSVAEAAALAAAGPGARLIAPRAISQDGQATCALAEREAP